MFLKEQLKAHFEITPEKLNILIKAVIVIMSLEEYSMYIKYMR